MNRGSTAASCRAGFTLVELLVAVAIMALVAGVVLAGGGTQRSAMRLVNEGYRVAALFRDAQTYGIGTHAAAQSFTAGFGVFASPATTTLSLFADTNHSQWFELGEDEVVESLPLGPTYEVVDVCARVAKGWRCASSDRAVQGLVAIFHRPNPEAWITTAPGGSRATIGKIVLAPRGTRTRMVEVEVYLTGALAVVQRNE